MYIIWTIDGQKICFFRKQVCVFRVKMCQTSLAQVPNEHELDPLYSVVICSRSWTLTYEYCLLTTYLVHIWLDCQDQIPKPLLHLSWCGQAGSESEFCFLFCRKKQNWLIDRIEFYAVLAIFQPAATKDFLKSLYHE